MSELAHWEDGDFVIRDQYQRDGQNLTYKEVFSELVPASFTQTIYEGPTGENLSRTLTIHATRLDGEGP